MADERDDFEVEGSAPAVPASGVDARPPRRQAGGWAEPDQILRSPSGRPLCRRCQVEIPRGSGRRTFCGEACVVQWKIRTQPEFAAERVHARDHGICACCGRDCDALFRKIRICKRARRPRRMVELGLPAYLLRRRRYWEVDHIVPVVEGGGSCGLENLRTLCWECHRQVTRALAVRRGKIRAA